MRFSLPLLATLALGCSSPPPAEPLVIGLLAPLSGPEQAAGKSMEQGALLAIEEAKDSPVHDRPVEALVVDTAGNAETTAHQAVRLARVNRVSALVGGPDAATASKLCRVGETYQLPVLTLAWLPADELGPTGFTVAAAAADRGQALARLGFGKDERVAVLTDSRDPSATALTTAFVASCQPEQLVFQGLFGENNAEAVLTQALERKPQAILVAGGDQAWWRGQVSLPLLWAGPSPDVAPGVTIWTTSFVAGEPAGQAFADRFAKRFGRPADVHAALAYDAVRLWLESARQTDPDKPVQDALGQWTDFPSTTGPLRIDPQHAARRPVYVLRRDGDAAKLAGVWSPQSPDQR